MRAVLGWVEMALMVVVVQVEYEGGAGRNLEQSVQRRQRLSRGGRVRSRAHLESRLQERAKLGLPSLSAKRNRFVSNEICLIQPDLISSRSKTS